MSLMACQTFCPLCNAAMVLDRGVGDKVLDFGNNGKLRNLDLVTWDQQTKSWRQQFLGEAIIGSMTGMKLKALPGLFESCRNFKNRFPKGQVLTPTSVFASIETYCCNPYGGYDTQADPYPHFLTVEMPKGILAMLRVVLLKSQTQAWSMALQREKKQLKLPNGVTLNWTPGQNSALYMPEIAKGRDAGNITATKFGADGPIDVPYFANFASVYSVFSPGQEDTHPIIPIRKEASFINSGLPVTKTILGNHVGAIIPAL